MELPSGTAKADNPRPLARRLAVGWLQRTLSMSDRAPGSGGARGVHGGRREVALPCRTTTRDSATTPRLRRASPVSMRVRSRRAPARHGERRRCVLE
eukprot:3761179-Prymnesium_polylepis.1